MHSNDRPFPSSSQPPFQSEAKCEVSVFIHTEIGTNYHIKNFALKLALKERLSETRKWPFNEERTECKLHEMGAV